MSWLRNVFSPKPPILNSYIASSQRFTTIPFKCRVKSNSNPFRHYVVSIDQEGNWACTCPDFTKEITVPGRQRYFCKHCIKVGEWTGLKNPMRWRRRNGQGWLVGEIENLSNCNSIMRVDGYFTSRELYETLDLTPSLIKRFLPVPDEVAVAVNTRGEETFSCDLYERALVEEILDSEEFKVEWEKTLKRRLAAQKSQAKRKETLERKRREAQIEEERARIEFGGAIFRVRSACPHGWIECNVYAKNTDHARSLVEKWLKSNDGREETNEIFEDAIDMYEDVREEYREAIRFDGYSKDELISPVRPKKSDFKLTIQSVFESNDDISEFVPEEIEVEAWISTWEHDIFHN